jgi:hypothetical protein
MKESEIELASGVLSNTNIIFDAFWDKEKVL